MNDTVASDQTFIEFARQFRAQFDSMSNHELYRVNVAGQTLWDNYLAAFPPFTNPIFRKRTVHDGSFDRNAIRNVGNVVAIIDNKIVSIWDIEPPYPYSDVCKKLSELVHEASLEELFRTKETGYGKESSKEKLESGGVHTWYHLNAPISRRHQTAVVGANIGAFNSIVQVFSRGLKEITESAVNEVLELMDTDAIKAELAALPD